MIMAGNMQYLLGSVHDHEKNSKLDTITAGTGGRSMITAGTGGRSMITAGTGR
jgi:hypothetical protein